MKSQYADTFNHDDAADGYDADVANELHPIRAGYREALQWLGANVPEGGSVLDLGTGTGNTIMAIPGNCLVTAVDISENMLAVAASKLAGRHVEFVTSDILAFFDRYQDRRYDTVISSYAIHHLIAPEKELLFRSIRSCLNPEGRAVFVDLMYRNEPDRLTLLEKYKDVPDVYESIEEEFFWDLDAEMKTLSGLGFTVTCLQFSDLSFGILAVLP